VHRVGHLHQLAEVLQVLLRAVEVVGRAVAALGLHERMQFGAQRRHRVALGGPLRTRRLEERGERHAHGLAA
jgi:hypothetical protein